VLVLRIVESWDRWLAAVWEGRGGMGKKKKEKQRKRVSAEVYIMVFTNGIPDGYIPSVIPSVILLVTVPCHCTAISV
jgi:hypothetical protein